MDSNTTIISPTPLSAQGFRAFAPEIREMIFKKTLAGTWNGKTPALIQALRGSNLHHEAMAAFTETNAFRLHEGNGWSMGGTHPETVQRVKTIQVDLGDSGEMEVEQVQTMFNPTVIKENRRLYRSVRCFIIKTVPNNPNPNPNPSGVLIKAIRVCACIIACFAADLGKGTGFTTLKVLTHGSPYPAGIFTLNADAISEELARRFESYGKTLITILNDILKQKAVLARVSSSSTQEWVWHHYAGLENVAEDWGNVSRTAHILPDLYDWFELFMAMRNASLACTGGIS